MAVYKVAGVYQTYIEANQSKNMECIKQNFMEFGVA